MEATAYSGRRLAAEACRRITANLIRGRESTVQLEFLLRSATGTAEDRRALSAEILNSFTEAIAVVDSPEFVGDELSFPDHSLCSDLDSGKSRRSPAVKDLGRGNKRRRLANSKTVMSATTEDGHAWRKYGQKNIHNTTHPRSYFRCTHKYDQGCMAIKQVQKMDGGSEIMYKITYISDHTCGPASPIAAVASASNSYICFSNTGDNQLLSESTVRFSWPSSDDDAGKGGDTTSGVTDEMDIWSELKDIGNLQEMTMATTTNECYFSTGDDADSSSPMFWGGVQQ